MRLMKKNLSFLLLLCLIISCLVNPVKAEDINNVIQDETIGSDVIRYTVLILDTSGSMCGLPEKVQKESATKFCDSIVNAQGTNYVYNTANLLKEKNYNIYTLGFFIA